MAKQGRSIYEWQQAFLFGLGFIYTIEAAEKFYNVTSATGLLQAPEALPLLKLGAPILAPLLLCIAAFTDNALRFPSRWYHFFAVLLSAAALSALGEFLIGFQGMSLGLPAEVVLRSRSGVLAYFGIICFFGILVTTITCIRRGAPRAGATAPAKPVAPEPKLEEPTTAVERDIEAPLHVADRSASVSVHRALLAFGGISIGMMGVILHRLATTPGSVASAWADAGQTTVILGCSLASLVLGGSLLLKWLMPSCVYRPTRWYHFFAIGIWLTIMSVPNMYATSSLTVPIALDPTITADPVLFAAALEGALAPLLAAPGYDMATILGAISGLGLIVSSIVVIQKPLPTGERALRPYAGSSSDTDIPKVKKKDVRSGKLPEPKLPALGAAMKLYVAADWLVLRLLGLGLLGAGYLLWENIEAGWVLPQLALSYGLEPMHALYAYGIVGALLAVPFLLPRAIVRPRHVLGGLFKAVILLFAGFVLLPLLPTAIELLAEKKYHETLNVAVPIVFKAVMGIAITSALLLSFFRQLGHGPKTDYLGKPVIEMSETELRRLRDARMGINA